MQPKDVCDLGEWLSEWSRCLTFKHQRDQLYRFGKFDDCSKQWADLKTAAVAKFASSEESAREMLAKTHRIQEEGKSPTAGVIWEMKEEHERGWQ